MTAVKRETVTLPNGQRACRINIRGDRPLIRFEATVPVCDCAKIRCKSDHVEWSEAARGYYVRQSSKDRCAVGYGSRGQRCHAWHDSDVDALIAKALRTCGQGHRAQTPTLPTRGDYRATKSEAAMIMDIITQAEEGDQCQ